MWTSTDTGGHPATSFAPGNPVYLLAAWHISPIRYLRRYHLRVKWDVFRGYQPNLRLVPLQKLHVTRRHANVPVTLQPGTFRLVYMPVIRHLRRGWYSLVGRVFLQGPQCPKTECSGQVRQTRFFVF
ncbi:MAG: hypothetical protein ACR2JC_05770 [Chloroflexota bacterium]